MGEDSRGRKTQSVEWIRAIVHDNHAHGAKMVKLHKTRVTSGKTVNKKETLNEVRNDNDIRWGKIGIRSTKSPKTITNNNERRIKKRGG
jgi:hypothetical protein